MDKTQLKKDEVILGTVKPIVNRMIGWIISSAIILSLLILMLVLEFNELSTLYNTLLIVFISLLFLLLGFKCFGLIKKYLFNEYTLTTKNIYVTGVDVLRVKKASISYSKIVDVKIYVNGLFKTYDIEIYSKKTPLSIDQSNKDVSVVIDNISKRDVDFIMNVINKYKK